MLNKNNFKQNFISPEKFEFYCQTGTEYEGFVIGKGYAWVWDGAVSPLDYAPKDWRLKYKTNTVIRYTAQILDTSSRCVEYSYNGEGGGGWVLCEDGKTIWDSRVNNDAQAKRFWGDTAQYRPPFSVGDVYVMIEKTVGGSKKKVEQLIKGALLENTNKIVKDGKSYPVEDMKGKEPWHIKTRNNIVDAGHLVYAIWLSGCEQLGEHIIFEVNGHMTAGNKLGGRYGIIGGSVDLGSVEFAKGKIDFVNPTKSAWGEKHKPYQASTGAGIDVGLGKNSGLSLGIGYEESWDYEDGKYSQNYLRRNPNKIQKKVIAGVSSSSKDSNNKFDLESSSINLNSNVSLDENKNTKVKEEHTIEIGWMVALFWSFGVNIRVGYKTEVKK